MKQRIARHALSVLLTVLFGINAYAQDRQVDALIHREMKDRRIPGVQVAVVQHQKIVLLRSYGMANLEDSIPVTDHSIFSINSCTKAFTGIAIMQLVEEGKIDLSAPVSRYLDSLPEKWQPVTIRQLLTHVSGLPDILQVASSVSEQEAWTITRAKPMDFPTGEQFSYNQTNYALLGKIIDKLSNKPFVQVFRDRQFQLAGMPNTCFGDTRDVIPHRAESYSYTRSLYGQQLDIAVLTKSLEDFPFYRRTASGLKSTASDLARWIIALQQGKLFHTKSSLNTLWTAGSYNNGTPTLWALGWMTRPRPQHSAVIATGGGRSAFIVYPDDDLAIIVLTNLAGASPEEFIDELAGAYNPAIPASDPVTALRIQLQQRGFEHTDEVFKELKKKNPNFQPMENDLNDWAYRMLSKRQKKEALEIFKLNVQLYPESWNVYDSYGEALMKNGRNEEAIKMYQKSVELNPQNAYGKKALEQLLKNPDKH